MYATPVPLMVHWPPSEIETTSGLLLIQMKSLLFLNVAFAGWMAGCGTRKLVVVL